jgi:hypothetical protein
VNETDLANHLAVTAHCYLNKGVWVAVLDGVPNRYVACKPTKEKALLALARVLHADGLFIPPPEPKAQSNGKETTMPHGWVPVPEIDYPKWKDYPKPYCDTSSHSDQISVTCVCDNNLSLDKSFSQSVAVCRQCGRVYRVKEKRSYAVEEYLGPER